MTRKRSKLQDDTSFRVLHFLQKNFKISQRELAQLAGVSVGGMQYPLSTLVDKGLVKLSSFTASEDKRRYADVLTPKGIAYKAGILHAFLTRKVKEYEALKAEISQLSADFEKAPRLLPNGLKRISTAQRTVF